MIRYRTRDLTVIFQEPCSCGRTQTKMKRVIGRSDDMLIIRGVNIFPSQVESVLLSMGDTAPHYQLLIDREHNLDKMTVMVEMSDRLLKSAEDVKMVERKICDRLKAATGVGATVRLVVPKTIERSEGKANRVVDNRKL